MGGGWEGGEIGYRDGGEIGYRDGVFRQWDWVGERILRTSIRVLLVWTMEARF